MKLRVVLSMALAVAMASPVLGDALADGSGAAPNNDVSSTNAPATVTSCEQINLVSISVRGAPNAFCVAANTCNSNYVGSCPGAGAVDQKGVQLASGSCCASLESTGSVGCVSLELVQSGAFQCITHAGASDSASVVDISTATPLPTTATPAPTTTAPPPTTATPSATSKVVDGSQASKSDGASEKGSPTASTPSPETASPVQSTLAPETATPTSPVTTTNTSSEAETESPAPSTSAPETTSPAPSATTKPPRELETDSPAPSTSVPETTTSAPPATTTSTPVFRTNTTTTPALRPDKINLASSSSSSSGSSSGSLEPEAGVDPTIVEPVTVPRPETQPTTALLPAPTGPLEGLAPIPDGPILGNVAVVGTDTSSTNNPSTKPLSSTGSDSTTSSGSDFAYTLNNNIVLVVVLGAVGSVAVVLGALLLRRRGSAPSSSASATGATGSTRSRTAKAPIASDADLPKMTLDGDEDMLEDLQFRQTNAFSPIFVQPAYSYTETRTPNDRQSYFL